MSETKIPLGLSMAGEPQALLAAMANRHGLIAGATGTGKTVTLQTLAEGFSAAGVPVFLADVKGDLAGLARPAEPGEKLLARIRELGIADYQPRGNPMLLWDLEGKRGHPLRTTVADFGPLLLSALLELNDTQTGVLYAAFRIADDEGLALLDFKDLRALLGWLADHARELGAAYGNITAASVGAIQRRLLVLEEQGAAPLFGEPALDLADLMRTDFSGQGVLSLLDATQLMARPRLYATFLLWLLAELFENLPEVGDRDRPRLVFVFDEAHLLFDTAPKALLEKIEQVVRLIRSKGVGIYFVTQNPQDVPEAVLGQLGNRVQHALRAFTPKDRAAVRAAAQNFRANPGVAVERLITELGVGEALVSVLDARGSPTPVAPTRIYPPRSRLGPLTDAERAEQLARSPLAGRYDQPLDRESAHELLTQRAQRDAAAVIDPEPVSPAGRGRQRETLLEATAKSALRAIGSQLGRQLVRGVLGSLLGGRRR
ncbi:MAG TPA: helicase HerA-like domain-containing protein [Nevskiaceae bacterium]|jgi:DNA helicase HerA-like ATPase|nr:helicase HerA-like domain-containing protein [Nevskiaceae bacterium]